jgi:arginase
MARVTFVRHRGTLAGMSILVPYHLDEYLADFDWPLAAEHVVRAELGPGNAWSRIAAVHHELAAAVARAAPRVTVIAGDCLSSLAVVAGLQRTGLDPAIVWFDAHGDVQTVETSTSGYPPEAEYLATSKIRRCQVDEVAPELLPEGPIYLHFDVDVIDPEDLPALTFPTKEGPRATAVMAALRRVVDTGRVAALNVACNWHPHRGTAAALRDEIAKLL